MNSQDFYNNNVDLNQTGVLNDINLLSVNSLISVKRKKSSRKKINIEEKNFEKNVKNLLQKKINTNDNADINNRFINKNN